MRIGGFCHLTLPAGCTQYALPRHVADRAAHHFDSSRRGVHFDMAIIAIGFYLELTVTFRRRPLTSGVGPRHDSPPVLLSSALTLLGRS
jgi:hypothetical protein